MRLFIWLLVGCLLLAHQDFWYWEDATLVYGFLPMGLFYHVCLSLAASFVWLIACTVAWPKGIDDFDEFEEVDKSPTTTPEGGAS